LKTTWLNGTSSTYKVSTVEGDTFILTDKDGKMDHWANSELENLKYTTAVGLTTFGNTTYPYSFSEGITFNNTLSAVIFKCKSWEKNNTCSFTPPPTPPPLAIFEEKAAECAKCDLTDYKCETCECGSADEACVDKAKCESSCKPTGPSYSCNWNVTVPQCVLDPKGKMD